MARSEWDLVRDMMNGKFTGDSPAVQGYFDKIRKAPNNAKALQDIAEAAENDDGLSSAELKEVKARVMHKIRTGKSSYDAKVKDAQTMSIHHQKFGDITARIVSSVPGGFFYTGYVSNGYKLYRNNGKEFVAVKLHFDKPTREGLANYFNADSKVGKWTDAWNEFDRIRRRLEPDWQAIMKEVKKLYEQHRGDPNWDEGYARFIGN